MEYTISQPFVFQHQNVVAKTKTSLWSTFITWATNEDKEHHIGWAGVSMICMAAVFFPVTMSVILFNGAGLGLIIAAMIPLALVITLNLAAMSTRYTIPFFFLGILIDAVVVIASFFIR